MARIKLLPFLSLFFITSDLKSTDFDYELKNKQKMDQVRKNLVETEPEVFMHVDEEAGQEALFIALTEKQESAVPPRRFQDLPDDPDYLLACKKKMHEMRRESVSDEELPRPSQPLLKPRTEDEEPEKEAENIKLGKDFQALIKYVLDAYPSAVVGLYHAVRHDFDEQIPNNFTVWELWALNDLIKLKRHIYEQLLNLSKNRHDDFLTEQADLEKIKRELLAGLMKDISRDVVVFTPTAWDITRMVLRFAYPADVLKSVDEGIRYSLCATPIAAGGVAVNMANRAVLINRGEQVVFKSFPISHFIFPLELLKVPVLKMHQSGSYLERWVVGAIALIICDLNHVGVLANYAHLGVDLAQLALISASLIPGAAVPATFAGMSLSVADHSINLKAWHKSAQARAHKKIIISLTSRLLSHNVLMDYLKDLGILQKTLPRETLRKTLENFGHEKMKVFHHLMTMVLKRFLFP